MQYRPADTNPGCLNHSRWLTSENRILRLYVSDKNPSEKLLALVMVIVRAYAPMWFAIKSHSLCKDGARHFHQMMPRSRLLSQEYNKLLIQFYNATHTVLTRKI